MLVVGKGTCYADWQGVAGCCPVPWPGLAGWREHACNLTAMMLLMTPAAGGAR